MFGATLKLLKPSGEVDERVPNSPLDFVPFHRFVRLQNERAETGCRSSAEDLEFGAGYVGGP